MRQTRTTYRRLKSGEWQPSSSLTAPMPAHVTQFLADRAAKNTANPDSKTANLAVKKSRNNVTT